MEVRCGGASIKKALPEINRARLKGFSSRFFCFYLFSQYRTFLLKFRTAFAVRTAADFTTRGFRISFTHE